jgi:hypothetical protein
VDVIAVLMNFFFMTLNKLKLRWCCVGNSKSHCVKSVASGELANLF